MLFKEELAQKIVDGVKTQTRRPIKAGEALVTVDGVKTVTMGNGKRVKYQVGREYAIQYGRGLPTRMFRDNDCHLLPLEDYLKYKGVLFEGSKLDVLTVNEYIPLKIRLLDVWAEDVRNISDADSVDEGFSCADEFLCTWAEFYDGKLDAQWLKKYQFAKWEGRGHTHISEPIEGLRHIVADFSPWLIDNRPENLYQAWALKFEVVRHG